MRSIGACGERVAARRLRRCGYRILARNQSRRGGEVDLIACRDGAIVLIEVKTRRVPAGATPADRQELLAAAASAFDRAKLRRVERAGERWLREHGVEAVPHRVALALVLLGRWPWQHQLSLEDPASLPPW